MKIKNIIILLFVTGIILSGIISKGLIWADEKGESHERHEQEGRNEKEGLYPVVENPVYKQECSSCHFLYLPGFLPARSWQEIIKNNTKHFGENLSLDEKVKDELLSYLTKYSAEHTNNEWSKKILKSIGSGTPKRITEISYIKSTHREIRPAVFKRPSIGSFSNCGACHPGGAQGDFEEDRVSIPN